MIVPCYGIVMNRSSPGWAGSRPQTRPQIDQGSKRGRIKQSPGRHDLSVRAGSQLFQ